jgi:hypothetical protein
MANPSQSHIAHQFVGGTKQTVHLPELRPLLLALFTVQLLKAIEPACAVLGKWFGLGPAYAVRY